MTMSSDATPNGKFAARCFKLSRVIHWMTVALVGGLVVTALFGGIDPHGPGNGAFLWHSTLGISVYLLSISRILLWLFYRSRLELVYAARRSKGAHRGLQITFYALLLALPISGWFLASEEGTSAHLLGIPALPQWYFQEEAQPTTALQAAGAHGTPKSDAFSVPYWSRLHAVLAATLSLVVVVHVFLVIRDRALRRGQHRNRDRKTTL